MLPLELDNVSISFMISDDESTQYNGTTIELYDGDSVTCFAQIKLTNKQLVQAMSRLMHTPVESCVMRGMDVLGKKREHKDLIFEIPHKLRYGSRDEPELFALADAAVDEGWEASHSFRSQSSFFSKSDKDYARTSQVRYVEVEKEDQ